MDSIATVVRVRPRRSLMSTAVVSVALGMLPIFGVLYWFGVQHDSWVLVLVVHLVLVLACLATLFRQLTVYSAVTATELVGRGIFSPLERVPLERIASVVLVPTFVGQSPEPVMQLLVRDATGGRLFRMRGNFWHTGDLSAIAHALPGTPHLVDEPISVREFYRTYPGSAYWFEDRPVIRVGSIVLIVLAAIAITAFVMSIFGMKVAFLS